MTEPTITCSKGGVQQKRISDMSNQELLKELLLQTAFATLPIEKWGKLFRSRKIEAALVATQVVSPSDNDFMWLRLYGFTVWIVTLREYLSLVDRRTSVQKEIINRKINSDNLIELSSQITQLFSDLLSLLTKEEQIYLNDHRLQLVHGHLSVFYHENSIGVKWYDPLAKKCSSEDMLRDQYREIISSFVYPRSWQKIYQKIDQSEEMNKLAEFYINKLNPKILIEMGQKLDVV